MTNIGTVFYILWFLGTSLIPLNEFTDDNTPFTNESISNNYTHVTIDLDIVPERLSSGPVQKIVIDAGHGGHDQGCAGIHSDEKSITLKIALDLGEKLLNAFPDLDVIYTRTSDIFVPLHERIGLANEENADLFVSIHANAFSDHKVSGSEVYVMGLHTAEENMLVAQRENASILLESNYAENYGGFDPNSAQGQIILSMFQNNFLDKSIMLAKMISDQIALRTSMKNRGVRQAGFVIFRKATMPCVLIETGFLSNLEDEKALNSSDGQQEISSAIANAVMQYKKEMDLEFLQMAELKKKTEEVVKNLQLTQDEQIIYRVQLAAYVHENDIDLPEHVASQAFDLVYENGLKKLIGGKFTISEDAYSFRDEMRISGFPEAFVVAYRGNERVSKNNVAEMKQTP